MILIISATQIDYEDLKKTTLSTSLSVNTDFHRITYNNIPIGKANVNKHVDIIYFYNNELPIAEVYNAGISYTLTDSIYTHVVFIHDDVAIEDRHFEDKVQHWLTKYDIIGLAGGADVKLKRPYLWHIMSKNRYGTVGHYVDGDWYGTTFGPTNKRVSIIDGLFMGMTTDLLRNKPRLRFDEELPGFHHYDIDFSLQANQQHCKIGVVPILVTHNSPGLLSLDDMDYIASETRFHNKYS